MVRVTQVSEWHGESKASERNCNRHTKTWWGATATRVDGWMDGCLKILIAIDAMIGVCYTSIAIRIMRV
jgi:hypothetical protein